MNLASAQLGVPVAQLTVTDGVVSGGGKSAKYSDLLGGKPFNAKITGTAPLKDPNTYKVVGTRVPRFDIPDKVTGKYTYIQNVRIPGMLHGRPVRPRGQANVFGVTPEGGPASFTLLSYDPTRSSTSRMSRSFIEGTSWALLLRWSTTPSRRPPN